MSEMQAVKGKVWKSIEVKKSYRLETLQEFNEAVQEFLPDGTIIIGSDGGSELYGFMLPAPI